MKKFALIALALAFLIAPTIIHAQNIEYVGSTLYSGPITAVSTSGNYAYASVVGMLLTFSISDPTHPTIINSCPLTCGSKPQFVLGNYLYSGSIELPANFQIIDISDPSRPTPTGYLMLGTGVEEIFARGNYAYLATSANGLYIVDISNPSNPAIVSQVYIDNNYDEKALSIKLFGDYALLGTNYCVYVINISNPVSPQIIWQSNSQNYSDYYSIGIADTLAYIASENYGIYIYNISDPLSPNLINIYDVDGIQDGHEPSSIILSNNLAYAINDAHLYIIDISNPASPNLLCTYSPPNINPDFYRVWLAYPYILIADASGFMRIVNVSDNSNPVLIGSYENYHNLMGRILLNGDYAYLWGGSEYSRMLAIIDITDSSNPAFVNDMELPFNIYDLYISENYGYVVSQQQRFYILNLSQPTNPQVLSTMPIPGDGYCAYKQGDFVYAGVRAESSGMYIINVSNLSNPTIVSRMLGGWWEFPERIIVRDTIAYSLAGYSLRVINVANPALSQEISNWDYGGNGLNDFDISENYAYILGNIWTYIVDISNPAAPFLVGHYVSGNCTDILVRGNYLYLSADRFGMSVVNISDPANPYLVAYRPKSGSPYSIDVRDDLIYVADTYSMGIYRFNPTGINDNNNPIPISFSLSQNYPNPFNASTSISYSLPKSGPVNLLIYNLLGQKVATLSDGIQQAGEHSIIWNAKDVSSGIYFAKLESNNNIKNIKMVLLK